MMVLAFVSLKHHGRFKKYRVEKAQASVSLTGLTGAIIGCALNHTTRLPKKDADLREVAFTFMIQLKGYSHGCIEVEGRFFDELRAFIKKTDARKLMLSIKYQPNVKTNGGTYVG
ncbi:hypothetical protein [Vibrio harveyi]|uniref:hypothetical protein n=1 Tax=Vibrio harveyi TaxID=669 RepID=UPI000474979C|nr:hypothetical protein [Vibrio harveyi]WJT08164.1 hypothetical protein PH545_05655 [Vibrio harveyi]